MRGVGTPVSLASCAMKCRRSWRRRSGCSIAATAIVGSYHAHPRPTLRPLRHGNVHAPNGSWRDRRRTDPRFSSLHHSQPGFAGGVISAMEFVRSLSVRLHMARRLARHRDLRARSIACAQGVTNEYQRECMRVRRSIRVSVRGAGKVRRLRERHSTKTLRGRRARRRCPRNGHAGL